MDTFKQWIKDQFTPKKGFDLYQIILSTLSLGSVLSAALIIYKILVVIFNTESPVVVVLSGSMEPSIKRGDLLLLGNFNSHYEVGDVVVYRVPGKDVPIIHRVLKVHEDKVQVEMLTKGDNNFMDDRALYDEGRMWLTKDLILGRAFAFFPYAGMMTILMNDYPTLKYALLGGLSLMAILHGDA